ncbi:MAG TPA: MlaD family protein [Thermoleophilaceae bacterium]|nr:MlaD family protein [Thermoleophilaceae bacterium]
MQKQAPSVGALLTMGAFALSCFGLLLFLWTSFGGVVPLAPEGYRVSARFDEATQLADNADVRISGVTVGRVARSELDGDRTRVEIEIEERYAPIPRDTRAILRQKTLLGETYVEIAPGRPEAGMVPDGGLLPDAQIRETVELDEILRSFDPETRAALKGFLGGVALAAEGRGRDLNDSVGNLPAFAEDTSDLLAILDSQERALRRLVRDTGVVTGALGRRQGELAGLVAALDTVLRATARRNADLAETVRILPTTLRELRPALAEVEAISREAAPLVRDLRPAGRALEPALRDATALAPDLQGLFGDVRRVISVARTALPATTRTVTSAHALFRALDPVLAEALPVVEYLGLYRRELTAGFAGIAASTQASERTTPDSEPIHYLRALVPFTQEGNVSADRRLGSNRHNPYFAPRALDKLAEGLESFSCDNAANPGGQPAPPCREQRPIEFDGRRLAFPHVTRRP